MSVCRIDFHSCSNDQCIKGCNKDDRQKITKDDLCTITSSALDSLPVRCVGKWAEKKIYLLYQYFGIFAQGMKKIWPEINYIEICSGPGRCINRDEGTEIDGTALAIIRHQAFQYIHKAFFFDYDEKVVSTLNQRINNLDITKAKAYLADYNNPSSLCDILQKECSKSKSLNLILLDPTDCSVPFELIKSIKSILDRVDFIINVATGTDFNRNIPMAFNDSNRAQKYERFLGNKTFFVDNIALYQQKDYRQLREKFRDTYMESMRTVGYSEFSVHSVENYYNILFAASHKKAIEFWEKAQAIQYDGQRSLF